MRGLRALLDPGAWRNVQPRLDPEAPSLRIAHRTDPGETKLRTIVGCVVLTLAGIVAYWMRSDGFAVFVACGFGLFALLNLLVAFLNRGFEMDVSLRPDEVVYCSKWMGRTTAWREPLSSYQGVLLREEHLRRQSIGNIESTKTKHVVELLHEDSAKTIPLLVQTDGGPPRAAQEAFAARFRLPALTPDSEQMTLSVAALVVKDPGPPPSGITLESRDGATRVVLGSSQRAKWLTALFWVALPLGFGALAYQIEPVAGYAAAAMATLFVLMIFGASRLMHGKPAAEHAAICLNADRIWVERPRLDAPQWIDAARTALVDAIAPDGPRESLPLESMPRNAVAQVRVDVYVSHSSGASGGTPHARLLIEAEAARLEYVGTQFEGKKLEWVRDYLRYRLAKGI
jgi:hypothetical protein